MQWLDKIKSLLNNRKVLEEHFLAVIFKERAIKAVLWKEKDGQVSVLDTSCVSSEKTLEETDEETLLKLTDQAIGLSEKTLPQNVKTTKTIFGLPQWWVEGASIKKEYAGKIKKIARELELTALGFVVIPEAISHLLTLEEGMPPTVLLVEIGENMQGVTLVRSGRIEDSKTAAKDGKTDSQTASELIKSFGDVEVLPSRMLLFDGDVSLEEAKQEFISYQWTRELSFLHFPKIDILPEGSEARAVISGAAQELGFSFEEEVVKAKTEDVEEKTENDQTETFGFVKEQDVGETIRSQEVRLEEKDEDEDEVSQPTLPMQPAVSVFSTIVSGGAGILTSLINLLTGFLAGFWQWQKGSFKLLIIGIFIPLIILLVGFFFVPSATITLYPQTQTLEKDLDIAIDTNATSVDKEKRKIPATALGIKQEGEKSAKTTGKKTVGEKAKGEITIYNNTENKKIFSKGTILLSAAGLSFTLDDEITVASKAAFALTPTSTKAKITAAQIGEEGNLPSNTNFPFKDFPTSSYFAKNETALAGGTKRDIVAVSKEDQDNLLKALTEELLSKAKEQLANDSKNQRIIDIDIKEDIASKEFSKKVDEEAENISLKLAINFTTLAYKDSDLLEIIGSEIEKDVPNGFTFQKDKFATSVKSIGKEKTGIRTLTMHYQATLIPNLDVTQIKNAVLGKSKNAVEKYLKSLPLENFTISQNISFPAPLNLLPQRGENITVKIEVH